MLPGCEVSLYIFISIGRKVRKDTNQVLNIEIGPGENSVVEEIVSSHCTHLCSVVAVNTFYVCNF